MPSATTSKVIQKVSGFLSPEFKQQNLRAWQPLFTPLPVILFLLITGILFFPIGVVYVVFSNRVREVVIPYGGTTGDCPNGTLHCTLSIKIDPPLRSPFAAYYELDNFYQNYRLYAKSKNQDQLEGKEVRSYSALSDCDPRRSVNGSHDPTQFYTPCGLIAWSRFSDTFKLLQGSSLTNASEVAWKKDGINWFADKWVFKNPPGWPNNTLGVMQTPDVEDPDFIVWMRTAAFPKFRKLYRKFDSSMDQLSGDFILQISNTFDVSGFGSKAFVLSEITWTGGKNSFLGWLYIATGILFVVVAMAFAVKQAICPRRFGDVSYLPWIKSPTPAASGVPTERPSSSTGPVASSSSSSPAK